MVNKRFEWNPFTINGEAPASLRYFLSLRNLNWKWFQNDAVEPITSLADENVKPTLLNDSIIRLRMTFQVWGGSGNFALSIKYSTDDTLFYDFTSSVWQSAYAYYAVGNAVTPTIPNGFTYYDILNTGYGESGVTEPIWSTVLGTTVVDNEVTWICGKPEWEYANGLATEGDITSTFKISDGMVHGKYYESGSLSNYWSLGDIVEVDLAIQPTADVLGSTTYYFQIPPSGSYMGYTHPQVLTAGAPPPPTPTNDKLMRGLKWFYNGIFQGCYTGSR